MRSAEVLVPRMPALRGAGSRRISAHLVTVALIAAPFGGVPVRAQTLPLDLRGAVRFALEHNANVLSREATLENDESQYARDHANEYPPVTGLLQNQLSKQSNVTSGTLAQYNLAPAAAYSQNIAQLGTQWTLYNGSAAQITAQQAKRQAQSARADLDRAREQLVQDVSNAYYTIAVRRESVRLDTADRAYQEALLAVARQNERVGRAAGVDVLRSQVNALRAQATLATAESDEAGARETLAQTIGADPDQPFEVSDVLPEPPLPSTGLDALVAQATANRPDIAAATATLAGARLTNSLIDTDRFPVLAINAAFGNQFSATSGNSTALNGFNIPGITIPTVPTTSVARGNPGFWQIGATETLQIGLLDYGARHAQHRAARAGIASAQTALTSARNAVETDVRQALRSARTASANLGTAKQASALGNESARIAQLQYKNGLISLTEATQAERDNLSAQNDLVNARVTYIGTIVRLRVSLGPSDLLAIVDLGSS